MVIDPEPLIAPQEFDAAKITLSAQKRLLNILILM